MRSKIKLPKLGDTVDEVVVIKWLVAPGTAVKEGQSLMSVETDKVDTDVPSPIAGRLVEQLVQPGDEVRTGAPIAVIESG